jgi:hypothetical protein
MRADAEIVAGSNTYFLAFSEGVLSGEHPFQPIRARQTGFEKTAYLVIRRRNVTGARSTRCA